MYLVWRAVMCSLTRKRLDTLWVWGWRNNKAMVEINNYNKNKNHFCVIEILVLRWTMFGVKCSPVVTHESHCRNSHSHKLHVFISLTSYCSAREVSFFSSPSRQVWRPHLAQKGLDTREKSDPWQRWMIKKKITVGLRNFWMYVKSIYMIGKWIIKFVPRPVTPPPPASKRPPKKPWNSSCKLFALLRGERKLESSIVRCFIGMSL